MNATQFPGQTFQPISLFNSNNTTPSAADSGDTILQKINQILYNILTAGIPVSGGGGSFVIPTYNDIKFTYYGATNNIQTQKFYSGATLVSTLTYTYAAGGAANDDLVTDIQQT